MIRKCTCQYVPPHVTGRILRNASSMLNVDPEAVARIRNSEISNKSFRDYRAIEKRRKHKTADVPSAAAEAQADEEAEAVAATGSRRVYDCQGEWNQRVNLIRDEGEVASGDADGDEVYEAAGIVYDFFRNVLNRDSIDDASLDLVLNVHYGDGYANAFWDGDEMTFGDGDGEIFSSFAQSLDVVAHELAHGVTQYTANLDYWSQSGALNEHFSDVFGTAITQYHLNQDPDRADWLIGNEIMGPTLSGETLRSMKAPGTAYHNALMGDDPQPAHMNDYYDGLGDNQGVHINSGILNRVFYLVATDQLGTERAAKLWYCTLQNLWPTSSFPDFAQVLVYCSQQLTKERVVPQGTTQTVRLALKEVGL